MSGPSLKYAHVERERRWLLAPGTPLPDCDDVLEVVDRYVDGTRLRLRETTAGDGTVIRKLGHKIRLGDGPEEIACTSIHLDEAEWALLGALPAAELRKRRHRLRVDGRTVAVDVFAGHCSGLVMVEVDGDPDLGPAAVGLPAVAEVTADERLTGGALAVATHAEVRAALTAYGVAPG